MTYFYTTNIMETNAGPWWILLTSNTESDVCISQQTAVHGPLDTSTQESMSRPTTLKQSTVPADVQSATSLITMRLKTNWKLVLSARQTYRKGYIFCQCFSILFNFFNGRHFSPHSSDANRAIFTKISGLVDGCKGLPHRWAFFDFSRDVAMATNQIQVEKLAFFMDQSTLSLCHSEIEWDNALYMQNIIESLMPL